jgi:hypothetical protein
MLRAEDVAGPVWKLDAIEMLAGAKVSDLRLAPWVHIGAPNLDILACVKLLGHGALNKLHTVVVPSMPSGNMIVIAPVFLLTLVTIAAP